MYSSVTTSSSFGDTFGSLLLGTCFGLTMFGMAINQTYQYFALYRSDGRILKATVLTVFLSNLLHSALCIHTSYYYLVQGEVVTSYLENGVWSLRLIGPMTPYRDPCARLLSPTYLHQYVLAGSASTRLTPNSSPTIPVTVGMPACILVSVVCLMLGTTVSAMFMAVKSFIIPSFAEWAHYTWLSAVPFGFILATDAILTGSLIYWLHRSRTGFQDTDSVVNVLIVYTINTGLLTSTLGLLCLIFAIARPTDFTYIALNMPTTNCYTVSMFAVLNSRRALAKRANKTYELGTFGLNDHVVQARGTGHSRSLAPISFTQRQSAFARPDTDTIPGHLEWRISVTCVLQVGYRSSRQPSLQQWLARTCRRNGVLCES
ncbi:hypothetical protein GY45DRAFT_216437 [Cubamyces sp. BRFM 1775]|nr:hypothetical protein GY45DRAFT_216437 [Cubamyces sp. BRFM 1775]